MTGRWGRRGPPAHNWWGEPLDLATIEVQGLPIRPGDKILVLGSNGNGYEHTYAGFRQDASGRRVYYTDAFPSTLTGAGCGPHPEHQLRHPDILTGLAKELEEKE